jgi:dipeptidyl aminopeptidase/acylaminoacyl peptidase
LRKTVDRILVAHPFDPERLELVGDPEQRLTGTAKQHKFVSDGSPDGRRIALTTFDPSARMARARWTLNVDDGSLERVHEVGFDERGGRFSPDGRWIAYESRESGRWEVYVGPFPGPGGNGRSPPTVARPPSGPARATSSTSPVATRCSSPT